MNPWPQRWPAIAAAHDTYWQTRGFERQEVDPGQVVYTGVVSSVVHDLDPARRQYTVEITYLPGFPYRAPRVQFVAPRITRSLHMSRGEPCLFEPQLWFFDVPPATFHARIAKWIAGHRTGVWANEIPTYELPAYQASDLSAVLLPETLHAAIVGKSHGGIQLRWLAKRIAVLHTISRVSIGDDLIRDLNLGPGTLARGNWFRLNAEPPPIETTVALREVLAASGHTWHDTRTPWKPQYLAVVFDDNATGSQRLLMIRYAAKRSEHRPATGWSVTSPDTHMLSRDEMFKRVDPVRQNPRTLDSARVTLLGLGAIGSHVADVLAREGVGGFRLCDPDLLKPGNLVRHTLDLRDVGNAKAVAMGDSLYRINPNCEVDVETSLAVMTDPAHISAFMADSDLIVSAIGDDIVEYMVSEAVTVDRRCPLLVVRTVHAGHVVRVMRIRPGVDACMRCLELHRNDGHPDWIHVPDPPHAAIYDEGCAAPSQPGANLAVREAANEAIRRVLDELGERDHDDVINHWVNVLDAIPGAEPRLTARGLHTATFEPHPGCPCECAGSAGTPAAATSSAGVAP